MSIPRLTLPFTISEGSALLLISAISLAAIPVSAGAAAPSPDEFTSTRWKPLPPVIEGRPLLPPWLPPWPRPPWAPRPGAAAGFAGAATAVVVVAGVVVAGFAGVAAGVPGVAGVPAGAAAAAEVTAAAAAGDLISASERNFSVNCAAGASNAIPTSVESLAKPTISTSIFHTPSGRSLNAYRPFSSVVVTCFLSSLVAVTDAPGTGSPAAVTVPWCSAAIGAGHRVSHAKQEAL